MHAVTSRRKLQIVVRLEGDALWCEKQDERRQQRDTPNKLDLPNLDMHLVLQACELLYPSITVSMLWLAA
jgi:hypothetical protein